MSSTPEPAESGEPTPPKTSAGAIWSLVLGILSTFCLWVLGSIPAIILGILAIRKIQAQPDRLTGKGLAIAGIITGSAGILTGLFTAGIVVALAVPAAVEMKSRTVQIENQTNLRFIGIACQQYHSETGQFPEQLEDLYPEYLDDQESLQWLSGEETTPLPYLYRKPTAVGKEPMVLSPQALDGEWLILFADGSTQAVLDPIDPGIRSYFE